VVIGRTKGDRGSYQQWKEGGIAPQVVFEILSPGNRLGAMNRKLKFYERYGVEEYYLYDPDRLDFAGWMRQGDRLESISQGDGSAEGELDNWTSPLLEIRFELQPDELKIYRPDGQTFLSFIDLDLRRQAAEQRADIAEQRADIAEQQSGKLAAKLRELGIDPENL
jgi:Uma2 family endonuclease